MKWLKSSGQQTVGFTILNGEMLQIAIYQIENEGTPQLLGKEEFLCKTTPLQERKKLVQSFVSRAGRQVQFQHLIMRDRVFTKQYQFPSGNMDEIKQMLQLRLPREMPFGLDQIVYHAHPIDNIQRQEFHTNVLVFGISKEIVNEERELLRSFGITPQQVLLSTIVLAAHAQKKLGTANSAGRIVVFGVGGRGEVLISNVRGVQFSRTFNYEPSDILHSAQDALYSTFDLSDSKEDLKSYDFCVAGDFENMREQLFLGEYIHRYSLHPPSQALSPIDFLMFAGANAHATDLESFNLLPEEVKAKLASVKSQSQFAKLRVLFVMLLVAAMLVSVTHSIRNLIAMISVNQKLNSLELSMREMKEVSRSVQLLQKIKANKIEPLDIFVKVHEKAMGGILLNEFEYDDKEKLIQLKGRTDSQDMVNQFVKALQEISWFKRVDLQYSESTSDGVRSQFQFSINASMAEVSKE